MVVGAWPYAEGDCREDLGDDFEEFRESVQTYGILQPLLVRSRPDGAEKLEVVAGKRRFTAAQLEGLREVPVIVHDLDDEDATEVALLENLHRAEFQPMEEARAFRWLLDRGRSQQEIADKLKVSQKTVSKRLFLLELSVDEQAEVKSKTLSVKRAERRVEARRWLKNSEKLASAEGSQISAVLGPDQCADFFDVLSGELSTESGLLDLDAAPMAAELAPGSDPRVTWRELVTGSESGLAVRFQRLLTAGLRRMEVANRAQVKEWVRMNRPGHLRSRDASDFHARKELAQHCELVIEAANALALDAFLAGGFEKVEAMQAFGRFLILALDRRGLEFFARRGGVEKIHRLADHELRNRVLQVVESLTVEQLALQVVLVIVSRRDGVAVVDHPAAQPWVDLARLNGQTVMKNAEGYVLKRLEARV